MGTAAKVMIASTIIRVSFIFRHLDTFLEGTRI